MMKSLTVRLERLPTRNGGVRQVWVAEETTAPGRIFGEIELEGRGRTRIEAIRRLALKPYAMDFDSVEWKVRYDFGQPAEAT
jgi:hypothetical protein